MQRYHLVDERHLAEDDLPTGNLMSAVVRIEAMRSPTDLRAVVRNLRSLLKYPDDQMLERTFAEWLGRVAGRISPADTPTTNTLEELEMSIEERVAEWPKQWRQLGFRQGVAAGRIASDIAQRIASDIAQRIAPDIARGIVQGMEPGERMMLERLVQRRFGEAAAERVLALLARVTTLEGLVEAGERFVQADTADALIAALTPLANDKRR